MAINHEIVKAELMRLKQQHGFLTPQLIVEEAKKTDSPLHDNSGFDWDVNSAAEKHWLDHARVLIKTIKLQVVIENTTYERPRFVVHPDAPSKKPVYVELADLQSDEREYQFLAVEFSRIEAQIKRAQSYAHALGLADDYNRMLASIQTFHLKLKAKLQEQVNV